MIHVDDYKIINEGLSNEALIVYTYHIHTTDVVKIYTRNVVMIQLSKGDQVPRLTFKFSGTKFQEVTFSFRWEKEAEDIFHTLNG